MNIVFDLGGVVFDWLPDRLAARAFTDVDDQQIAREEIIGHPDWLELDRGSISQEQAIVNAVSRTGLPKSSIAGLFQLVGPLLTPIQPTIDLVHELAQASQHKLYVLSNMHQASIDYLEANFDFWDLFEAKVISCRVGMVKPEPAIYNYLLRANDLAPGDTVFIDDMPPNITAAQAAEMKAIQFEDTHRTRMELIRMGCL